MGKGGVEEELIPVARELGSMKLNSAVSCLVASEAWEEDTLFDLIYHSHPRTYY